jgi:hypothetical protein
VGTEINISDIRFRPKSYIARLAAWVMRAPSCALVLGRTIHLYGADISELTTNRAWMNHELAHVAQYRRYGFLPFIFRYIWYSIRFGYYQNPLEIEARAAEKRSL